MLRAQQQGIQLLQLQLQKQSGLLLLLQQQRRHLIAPIELLLWAVGSIRATAGGRVSRLMQWHLLCHLLWRGSNSQRRVAHAVLSWRLYTPLQPQYLTPQQWATVQQQQQQQEVIHAAAVAQQVLQVPRVWVVSYR